MSNELKPRTALDDLLIESLRELVAAQEAKIADVASALTQIRDLSGESYDSDRAWALAMQLRAKVALQGWLGGTAAVPETEASA